VRTTSITGTSRLTHATHVSSGAARTRRSSPMTPYWNCNLLQANRLFHAQPVDSRLPSTIAIPSNHTPPRRQPARDFPSADSGCPFRSNPADGRAVNLRSAK
jgi:hypothetical protein